MTDPMAQLCEHLRRIRHIILNKVPFTAPEALSARWGVVSDEVAAAERAVLALAKERRQRDILIRAMGLIAAGYHGDLWKTVLAARAALKEAGIE